MHEAIDYNALSWVRNELGDTLKQARVQLEEYAADTANMSLLQQCAAGLHEALGPLHMVGLKGAIVLTSEMEEVVADLLQDAVDQPDTALEFLMQAFLQLPDYLFSIRSGRQDKPQILLPLINSLRATRGEQPLEQAAMFSPNLSVRVPAAVFDVRAKPTCEDIQAMARSARVRFQGGLLEWYRNADSETGLVTLIDVLNHLQKNAASEPVARIWWAGAAVASALRDGSLEVTVEAKQLFGHLDRQIKRLMDGGEAVFDDVLSDDLMKRLLFQCAHVTAESDAIRDIRETYGFKLLSVGDDHEGGSDDLIVCNDEMLEAVAMTLRGDIEQIKDTLDHARQSESGDTSLLESAANGLHAVANTLDMIGLNGHATPVADWEQSIRGTIENNSSLDDAGFVSLANMLVAVEDAIFDVAEGDAESAMLGQGINAVTREVVASMGIVKESITAFLQSSNDHQLLENVPELLNQIAGGLGLTGQDRAASAADQVKLFVTQELIKGQRALDEKQVDSLADAICSIEFFIEEISENRSNTGTALDVAEESLYKLGYPSPYTEGMPAATDDASVPVQLAAQLDPVAVSGGSADIEEGQPAEAGLASTVTVISTMQVIAADADEEILEIFIEEADEELQKLTAFIPMWVASAEINEYLSDIRRSLHTLKGSGRMVGAMAVGEYACVLENLANNIIEGTVVPHDTIKSVFSDAVHALALLMGQVKGEVSSLDVDIDALAGLANRCCDPDATFEEFCTVEDVEQRADVEVDGGSIEWVEPEDAAQDVEALEPVSGVEDAEIGIESKFPILSADADAEIVEIFLEEADEEIVTVSEAISEWINQPDNEEALTTIRRSLHTLKGSGRMAGAMLIGEFSWVLEELLNRLIEGTVGASDGLRSLVSQLPEALSQLVEQLKGGTEPEVDIASLMQTASALAQGEEVAVEEVVEADLASEPDSEDIHTQADENDNITDTSEPTLLELFVTECAEHLQVIEEFLNQGDEARIVTESLYRALHTISGISESADVTSISRLAGGLNKVFDGYYQARQAVSQDAINVLDACASEITLAMQRMPDLTFDEASQHELCERIASLPCVVEDPLTDVVVGERAADECSESVSVQVSDEAGDELLNANAADDFASMDQELYEIFVEEVSEIMDGSEGVLRAWSEDSENTGYMTEFQRHLHTIKGGARMMDIKAIGDLSHALESLMTRIADGLTATSDELFLLMQESHDRLSEMLEQVKARVMPEPDVQLEVRIEALCGIERDADLAKQPDEVSEPEINPADAAGSTDEPVEDIKQDAVTGQNDEASGQDSGSVDSDQESGVPATREVVKPDNEGLQLPRKAERRKQARAHGEQVRIQSNVLDDMVNYAGEINIYRSRMEQQVSDYRFNLAELDQTITRLRDQLRQLEMETEAQILYRYEQEGDISNQDFDPLEMDRYSNLQQLSRSLIESISDLHSLQELMENTTRESESLMLQQSRVSTDLQEGLMRTRMIPFSGLSSRLRRIVRQSARQLGKKVDLELVGADGEMDRTVIDRIIAPLEHMLRNAVAHGIEDPGLRKESGKQASGTITITFDREGPEIVLRIEDDGAGINTDAIRARAVERGLMSEESQLSDNDVMQFILQSGFSTADEVTQISGRGVGMDVVNSEVKQLGGSLHIESTAGLGTLFTVRLPYTLAINQALLVMAGNESFCIPLGSVEGVVRANPEELFACYRSEECIYQYAGNDYQLKHLGTLLNTGAVESGDPRDQVPVLLVRIGEKRIALQVESLLGSREIVIKPVGAQLSTVDCISGATILGDGSVVMILDMAAVARMNVSASLPETPVVTEQDARLAVMVVDDSITVRKVTTRLLERNGYMVMTAKDGVDAMGQLQDTVPDMMLLDIEMPRMDGFELATHMRSDERLKHVPIIMITSRTGDKHRERAQKIGVNNYLGKPYQENDLLDSIHRIIGVSDAGAVA